MKTVQIKDKEFTLYISREEIEEAVQRIAAEITGDLKGKDPLFLVILNGAFMFASDLFRELKFPCEISFAKLASYQGTESTEKVKELIGVGEEIKGRHLIIVEDIIDTGITLEHLQKTLHSHQPASVRLASLLFKPLAFQKDYIIHYKGIDIPNDFVVGYGLDYDGHGRNYPDIYKVVDK